MTHILLISPDNALFDSFRSALPTLVEIIQLPSLAEAQPYLAAAQSDEAPIDLILLHARNTELLVKMCKLLRISRVVAKIPVVVLLNDPEDRRRMLACGADDYLLLPLIPAEINARVEAYLRSPLQIFRSLSSVIEHLKKRITSADAWEQCLHSVSKIFKASAAWVFLLDKTNERTILIGGHNIPPLLAQKEDNLYREIDALFQMLAQSEGALFREIIGPYQAWPRRTDTDDLMYHILVPLYSGQQLFGVLTLAYKEQPTLSSFERQTLNILGQNLGVFLESHRIQEEIQSYATQNAFMVLIARTISERLDLNSILSLTLEQVVPLVNASGGDIWMLTPDETQLDLTSSLASPLGHRQEKHRLLGQGLIGWVAARNAAVYTTEPAEDPRYDDQVDQLGDFGAYSLVAVPLNHRNKVIGVLAVYSKQTTLFTNRDTILLEGIASLTASAIANARMLQELRENAEQRRILYEMSQQIAAGLDLQATLDRTLPWIGRLFDVEVGLLWIVDQSKKKLQLAAGLGVNVASGEEKITVTVGEGIIGQVAKNGKTLLTNDPLNRPDLNETLLDMLEVVPHNILAAPMTYHGQAIGVLSLINKNDGLFDETDMTLLSTALEIIAVAVGNARLYTQTVSLMGERERLHQQVLQAERLATLGRLTAVLSHEINNPMQAIQGALTLSLEEINNPTELETYIHLSLDESSRVVNLLNRMRQVYRPQTDTMELIDLHNTLQETIALARKELKRQKIRLHADLAADLPRLNMVANQIHLVFLSLLLNLSDAIGAVDGHDLYLRSYTVSHVVRIEFSTHISALPMGDWLDAFKSNGNDNEVSMSLGLSLSQDIIVAHGGVIELDRQGKRVVCRIELPIPEMVGDER